MSALSDRIRTAREGWVTADGKEWLIRRPTQLQVASHIRAERENAELVFDSVVGWRLTEAELAPGGGGRVPDFDADAFREYASDRPDLLSELARHINRVLTERAEALKVTEKN